MRLHRHIPFIATAIAALACPLARAEELPASGPLPLGDVVAYGTVRSSSPRIVDAELKVVLGARRPTRSSSAETEESRSRAQSTPAA